MLVAYASQNICPQPLMVLFLGKCRQIGHIGNAGSTGPRFFAVVFSNRFAGHPAYATPESATSPEVKRVCSQSILLSSMEAPESNLDPDRMAHWFPILR
jgi:hypothetical protein